MAANAYSITHVPTHQRGGPVTQAVVAMRQSERAPYEGRGCIVMDGQLVVFEAGRRPGPGSAGARRPSRREPRRPAR